MDGNTDDKPKQRKGIPPARPGAFEIKTHVVLKKRGDAESEFTHDNRVPAAFALALAARMHSSENRISHDPLTQEEYSEVVLRMVSLLMAKKLATSLTAEDGLRYGGALSRIGRVAMSAPTSLIPIIDGYGKLSLGDLNWKMTGQAAHALTYFCRATAPNEVTALGIAQQVDREDDWFINCAWPRPVASLLEAQIGIVNAWAENAPSIEVTVGGARGRIQVPKVVSNLRVYLAFVGGPNAVPDNVRAALRRGAALEDVAARANGNPIAADVELLNAQDVIVVNWSAGDMDEAAGRYYTEVEVKVQPSFEAKMPFKKVLGLKDEGAAWQLVKKISNGSATSPVQLSGDAASYAWMLAGEVGYEMRTDTFGMMADQTQLSDMVKWIEGMQSGKN